MTALPPLTLEQAQQLLWYGGDLSFLLHPHQLEVRSMGNGKRVEEVLFLCARQWGKSFYNCVTALEFAIRNPNSIVRIAAPTLKQAQEIVETNLAPICLTAPKDFVKRTKSEYRWNLANGSSIRLGALERANVDSLRGGNAKLIIAEEGGFVNSDDYVYAITSAIGPQLLRSGGQFIHVTTPSDDPDHYIHTEVLPKCELSGALIRQNIYSNTALTPAAIEQAARLCGGVESDAFKREYLVEIVRSQDSLILPEFSKVRDVADLEAHPKHYTVTSIDFGGVLDPTAVLIVQYAFKENQLHVLKELEFPPNTNTEKIVEKVRELEQGIRIDGRWADNSGQGLFDLRELHDFNVNLPAKQDKKANVNALRVAFANGEIRIDSSCQKLIASLNAGRWDKPKKDFMRTKALGHCDTIDALLYAFRMIDRNFNPFAIKRSQLETEWVSEKILENNDKLLEAAKALIPALVLQRRKK